MARQKKPTLRQTCEAQQLRLHEQADTIQHLKRQVANLRERADGWQGSQKRIKYLEEALKDARGELHENRNPEPNAWPLPILIGIQRASFHLQRMGKLESATALLALIDTVAGEGEPVEGGLLGEGGLRRARRMPMDAIRQIEWREDSLHSDMERAKSVRFFESEF